VCGRGAHATANEVRDFDEPLAEALTRALTRYKLDELQMLLESAGA